MQLNLDYGTGKYIKCFRVYKKHKNHLNDHLCPKCEKHFNMTTLVKPCKSAGV